MQTLKEVFVVALCVIEPDNFERESQESWT